MFNLFDNLDKRKKLIDEELRLYETAKKLEIHQKLLRMREEALEQLGQFEHDYHSSKESKGVDLASLEGQLSTVRTRIEYEKADNVTELRDIKFFYEKIVAEKDKAIDRLTEEMKVLIAKLPEVNLKDFNVTCNKVVKEEK